MKFDIAALFRRVVFISLLLVIVFAPTTVALAQAGDLPEDAWMDPAGLFTYVGLLGGFGWLVTVVVNILKTFGLPDTWGGKLTVILKFTATIVLFILSITGVEVDVIGIDTNLGLVAKILEAVLGFLSAIGAGAWLHDKIKGRVPVLGASYSQHYYVRG